ncbi:hypothetical protein B0H12DRAFT_278857 [Mycena haematopus]|nr:hypothetical protein B0H12DRAFT_278857 [Mycena haematopus]
MSHTSPASYLVWGIISVILFVFLVYHMYSFDHFRCLKWNRDPESGTFKRIMTYSYLLGVPLIMTYAVGFAIIKYRQGFVAIEGVVIPKPYTAWPEAERRAIFPLMLTFAVAWSFEMITHLEELCFWFFVVMSSGQQNWFRSRYFRVWIVGSCVAIIYMPLLTILSRADPLRSEAFTFLGGSLGSLCLTLSFTPILWTFPEFLASLVRSLHNGNNRLTNYYLQKAGGVDAGIIVRLTKFHELNTIRIVFRLIFVLPLFILGVDGVRPHKHINESMLWTDFLTMIAAFGCCISSALTLVIFFPRSVEDEIAAKDAAREKRRSRRSASLAGASATFPPQPEWSSQSGILTPIDNHYPPSIATERRYSGLPSVDEHGQPWSLISSPTMVHKEGHYDRARDVVNDTQQMPMRRPSQHYLHRRSSSVNAVVHNFTSPIDVQ